MVRRIAGGDRAAETMLHEDFHRGITTLVNRALRGSSHAEEVVNDIFIAVITNIRRGCIEDGRTLPGYIRTIMHRRIATEIHELKRRRNESSFEDVVPVSDRRPNPEQEHADSERRQLAIRILASLPPKQREILRRFYFEEQRAEQICADMNLTETQFRLLKSRAKARFGRAGRTELMAGRFRALANRFRRSVPPG
jgi:RNA polymerase sigma factor (sigma-70 family)